MEFITSVKNPLIVEIKNIKENSKDKLFIENPKLIKEAYLAGLKFDYVLVSDSKIEILKKEYDFLKDFNLITVGDNVIKHLSEIKTPQGIIAIIQYSKRELKKPEGNFIVLENLQDPGNLGTIIRSARGTNFKDLYLINCVNFCNQKVIRSAMGNIFGVNLYALNSTEQFVTFVEENNLKYLVADLIGENLFNITNPIKNIGVAVGNEGKGISDLLAQNATKKISIPMKNGLESLNAGVSCSIIIYYLDNLK